MLHTDAFNKSNKRKMTKPDYIKNTRLPGVAPEVLDVGPPYLTSCANTKLTLSQCFYDNIVFAPFIFIEDPLDVNGQRGLVPEAISRRMSTINMASPGGLNGSGSTLLGKSNKIDPYYLITRVRTHSTDPLGFADATAIRIEPPGRPPSGRARSHPCRKSILLSRYCWSLE